MDILHANILLGRDRRRDGHKGHSQLFLPWWRWRWLLLGFLGRSCWSDGWGRPQFSQKVAHLPRRRWCRRPFSQASCGAHRLALGSSPLLITRTYCAVIITTTRTIIGIRTRLLGIAIAAAAPLVAGEPIEDLGREDGAEGEEAAALLADSTCSGGRRRRRRRRRRSGCGLGARGRRVSATTVAVAVAAAVTTEQVHYVAFRSTRYVMTAALALLLSLALAPCFFVFCAGYYGCLSVQGDTSPLLQSAPLK